MIILGGYNMIILASGSNVSVVVRDRDLLNGNKNFFAFFAAGYYDPRDNFRPCFDKPGATPRRRLYDKYAEEYATLLTEAETTYERVKKMYDKEMGARATAPVAEPAPAPAAPTLGTTLEQMLMASIAEMSVGKVVESAKPMLEKHIIETFGMLPQKHVVVTPAGTTTITGVVHERFDMVLDLVNADIPVFLTGPAGTGKNVICKQVAKALGLEFYFSNAVTQEYKISGFIDANGTYHTTQFYEAFTKGGLFMLDEMDASIPEVLVMLNAAIANRYFDFPTGRVEAHEDFRLIAAGNTFGTGADIEYTGRYQLDAASLDRFAMVDVYYSPAIEKAIANGDEELINYIHAFRKATAEAGMKFLATYRSIERIKKLDGLMTTAEVLKICLLKGMTKDDMDAIIGSMRSHIGSENKYFIAMKQLCKQG